jgi:hypothetical protein
MSPVVLGTHRGDRHRCLGLAEQLRHRADALQTLFEPSRGHRCGAASPRRARRGRAPGSTAHRPRGSTATARDMSACRRTGRRPRRGPTPRSGHPSPPRPYRTTTGVRSPASLSRRSKSSPDISGGDRSRTTRSTCARRDPRQGAAQGFSRARPTALTVILMPGPVSPGQDRLAQAVDPFLNGEERECVYAAAFALVPTTS